MTAKTGTSVDLPSLLRNWPRFGFPSRGMTILLFAASFLVAMLFLIA